MALLTPYVIVPAVPSSFVAILLVVVAWAERQPLSSDHLTVDTCLPGGLRPALLGGVLALLVAINAVAAVSAFSLAYHRWARHVREGRPDAPALAFLTFRRTDGGRSSGVV